MNTNLVIAIIIILAFCIGFMVLYFSHKSGINMADSSCENIKEPNIESKLVYEKAALDINLKKLEDLLIVEQSEIGRILIHEQLAIMRRYSNVLAVRIALSGN